MRIKKVQLSEKDKRRAYRTAVRKAALEAGLDKITGTKVYRNRKRYTRKSKKAEIRKEQDMS